MPADQQAVQGRTGFHDWNNHMTCVQVPGDVAEVARQLEQLAVPGPVPPRAYEAVLDLTWGAGGVIAVRCEASALAGLVTISHPLPGPTADTCVVWLEASPSTCRQSALYDLGVELSAQLRTSSALSGWSAPVVLAG